MDREPAAKKVKLNAAKEEDTAVSYPVQLEHVAPSNAAWYAESLHNPEQFWGELARQRLRWMKEFDTVMDCEMREARFRWFVGGQLNVSGEIGFRSGT